MSGSNTVSVSALLEKMKHYDKDERYMATSDLCEYLKRSGVPGVVSGTSSTASPLDQNTEKRVCASVLKLLDDASHDVQTMAVKTLSVLLTTVHEDQVVEIADRLGTLILDPSKAELRDVYAIGLRTLVKTIPTEMGDHVSQKLIGKLLNGIRGESKVDANDKKGVKASEEITISCLEILADFVERFGTLPYPSRQQDVMVQATLSQLGSESMVVRKRAGNTLGSLSLHLDDALLSQLVEILLAQIDASFVRSELIRSASHGKVSAAQAYPPSSYPRLDLSSLGTFMTADAKTLIRAMSTLSGVVGHRLDQEQIDRIVPIFLKFCDPMDAIAGDDNCEHDNFISESALVLMNELREGCFAGLQSFILRCHNFIQPHMSQIIQSSLAYMRYDPNYSYGDEDDDELEDTDMGTLNQEDEDDSEYEEDDNADDLDEDGDESYKLRRQAIQVLIAVSHSSKHDEINRLWTEEFDWKFNRKKTTVVAALVDRFKEREENCRVDIVECFTNILSSTVAAQTCGSIIFTKDDKDTGSEYKDVVTIDLPEKFVSQIISACDKKLLGLKKGGARTKTAALALLSILCHLPGGMGGMNQLNAIFNHLKSILNNEMVPTGGHGSAKALKLDALRLIRTLLVSTNQDATVLKDIICNNILKDLCSVTQESWYKIVAEGLRVLSEIPRVISSGHGTSAEKAAAATQLFMAIEPRLLGQDQDQEIKDCALSATSSLLSIFHRNLDTDKKLRLLNLILDKLRNETTRIFAIKVLTSISLKIDDDSGIDLSPIFADALNELTYLLRLSNRVVKQSALECLAVFILSPSGSKGAYLTSDLCASVVKEISLIIQTDMHMNQLSIQIATNMLKTYPSVASSSIIEFTIPAVLSLAVSPMMQESTLESLLSFLKLIVSSETVSCQQLLENFFSVITPLGNENHRASSTKVALGNLAKCVAAIVLSGNVVDKRNVLLDMLSVMESDRNGTQPYLPQLYLKAIGDIGNAFDLSSIDGLSERLEKVFFLALDSSSEDEKQASAYGLGRVSAGAVTVFLPKILTALKTEPHKKQYSILSSVREFIHSFQKIDHSQEQAIYIIDQFWPYMSSLCTEKEEGLRTMAAECIGSMMMLDLDYVLPRVVSLVADATNNNSDQSTFRINICWTVATSVKFAIAGRVNTESLSKYMPKFLVLLNEEDLSVQNAALLIVYSAVHHAPKLIDVYMDEYILPHLYSTSQLILKRTVDLGPFKHTVDDALPLRKSAISIFHLCMEKSPGLVDINNFLPILVKALDDVEDIQLQAHQIVLLMCSRYPAVLTSSIDSLVNPLERSVNKKPSALKSGNELDRSVELVKSALRVMMALNQVDGASNSEKFSNFFQTTKSSGKFNLLESRE